MWASDKLCRDVLVEMVCLLRGSREDVEKSAPSQLLQGVLQCRGLTGKLEGKRQFVWHSAAYALPPFTRCYASLRLPDIVFVFYSHLSLSPQSHSARKRKKKKKQRELKAPYGRSWLCTSLFGCIGVGQTGWSFFYPESLASQYRRTVCSSISQLLK